MLRIALVSSVLFLVAACGGSADGSQPGMSEHAKSIDATDAIVESGFAESESYINLVAIVENPLKDPKHGHEIDVTFELLDAQDKVVDTATGYGAFAWVASDPTSSPVEPGRGRIDAEGTFAEITIDNPRDEPLSGFELVVVCRDDKGAVSAVGTEDVDKIPAGGKGRISAVVVGSRPGLDCLGYPGVGI